MSSILKDDLKGLLNCSICLDNFTEPKLLPCAHRFCKECLLREIARSATSGPNPSFPCPLCKRSINLPRRRTRSQWIDHFETDCLLNGILERIEDKQKDVQGAPFKSLAMASVLKDDLEIFLSCSVCLDTFNDPKLLPCAHRFCKTCLLHEMNRSANPTFLCPLCKRNTILSKRRPRKDWIDLFETDRLFKEIVEKIGNEIPYSAYVCVSHKLKADFVCYCCGLAGCITCVQEKHRHCGRIETLKTEAERIDRDLCQNLLKIQTFIQKMTSHIKKWTSIEKSFRKQEHKSNRLVDQVIQRKKDRFQLRYSYITELFDLYIRQKTIPKKTKNRIQKYMKMCLEKLNIDAKCKVEEIRLKEINRRIMLSDSVSTASEQLANAPDTRHLANTMQDISRILELDLIEMVFQGQQLLTENKYVLSDQYQSHILQSLTEPPATYVLSNLIMKEHQVTLGITEEENILDRLKTVIETADNPSRLLYNLDTLFCPEPSSSYINFDLRGKPVVNENAVRSRKSSNNPKVGAPRDKSITEITENGLAREDRCTFYLCPKCLVFYSNCCQVFLVFCVCIALIWKYFSGK